MCQTSERTLIRKCKIFLKENAPPCILCEDSIPDHLEFDHVDRILKTKAISSIRTVEELIAEIPKVRVLCKKCHRKITYLGNNYNTVNPVFIQFGTLEERRKIYEIPGVKRNRDFINNLKLELKGCQNPLCNDIFDPENLPFYEWDHVDCRTKKYQISVMVSTSKSIDSIKQELEKCQLLCGYCHSIKTRQDQKLMKEYYQSLTEPLIKKGEKKISWKNSYSRKYYRYSYAL